MLPFLTGVPVVASVVLGSSASWAGRRLPPATAVKVLSVTAVVIALATGFCMSVLAFNALARMPVVAALGQWSANALGLGGAPSPLGGLILGLVVLCLMITVLRRSVRTVSDLASAVVTARRMPDLSDGLVVLHDLTPDAFALPGLRGKIVITTSMLKALTSAERRALIAHEQAHLAGHHQIYVQAANLAAAANPMLIPVARHVRLLIERWADEDAATEVGDRRLTARALAKAAIARSRGRSAGGPPRLALPAVEHGLVQRALALGRPRPSPRPLLMNGILALAVCSMVACVVVGRATEAEFDYAHRSYVTDLPRGEVAWGLQARTQPRDGQPVPGL